MTDNKTKPLEGLVIDKTTTMAHLKGCLIEFVKTYFDLHGLSLFILCRKRG